MSDSELIQPKTPDAAAPVIEPTTPPATPPADAPAADSQASGLSEDLMKLPTIQALMAGSPAAASGSLADFSKRPEAKIIASNKDPLMQAGFGFYKSIDGQFGVVFNGLYIHGDQIKQADQSGKLQQVAPPFDQIASAVATSGANHPVLAHNGQVPEGLAGPPMTPPASPMAAPAAPAGVQKQLQTARLKNAAPGSPTSGPSPGAGRLMNSVMKPVQ